MITGKRRLFRLKSMTRSMGNQWHRMKVDFKPLKEAKEVSFRLDGVVGNDFSGDIAVDDVAILPGECSTLF